MSENLSYWYSPTSSSNATSDLPPQAIPTNRKNDRWKKATMDALERIGLEQLRENLVYGDFYRMIEGKMAYTELADAIPQLREVAKSLNDLEIPAFIKHYDLIGIIINALVGEYMQNRDKFMVTNTDEFASSEYERTKLQHLHEYVQQELEKEYQIRMIQMGINPNPDAIDIEDPQQKEAAIQEIQAIKQKMTPPEIEKFMNKSWKTDAVKWGELTLEADYERFYMLELERGELVDFLLTGRCFRHHRIGYDNYKPETWSPKNTFFSKTLDTKYPQYGEYVGRVHFYAPSEVVNKYGAKLNQKQKDRLLIGNASYEGGLGSSNDPISFKQMFESNFGATKIVPHKQFYDYNFMTGLEDELGLPLAERTVVNKDGTTTTVPTYLPRSNEAYSGANFFAQSIRDDLKLRRDLIRTTEVYWVSYQRIAYFTYVTPEGRLTQEIVTDEILKDFLKDEDISTLRETTLEEIEKNPQPNTVVWDYIPQVWRGVKLNRDGSRMDDAVYLDIEPLDLDLSGDSNLYDRLLPVSGIIDSSLALKMQPYQMSYNVVMNQLYNLLEKEIGLFFVFDINYLPSEFKDWGNTEETLVYLRDFAKDVGLFGLDTTKQNLQSAGGFNQFAPQDLSLTGQMSQRVQLSEFYKNKAFEQIGFNPQRLGTPVKYETAEGVRQSQTASYAQTEMYFEKFADYKKRSLEMHLNVAQYCQRNNKDISVYYTKSDGTKAYLKFTDENFQLRKLGILPISNSKKRKELETFRSYLMQNNTTGADELSLAEIFTSDSMSELIETARVSRMAREQQAEQAHQRQMQAAEQQAALEEQKEQAKWEREEISKERDRATKLEEERINALGRAADKDASIESFNQINREADLAIKKQKTEDDTQLKLKEIENKEEDMREKRIQQAKEFNLRVKELEEKRKERESREYIARINKN